MIIACIAGYTWLFYSLNKDYILDKPIEVCLIKKITNIPCPACGSTRSILALIKGEFKEAYNTNPIGFLIALSMILIPPWISIDLISKKSTLFNIYQKTETYLKRPPIAFTLILIVIVNWLWNITKGL